MTAAFSARRRADEFEALLSRDPATPLTEREAARHGDLLAVVGELRAVPDVAPRPEFSAALRERLMAEADTALVAQPPAPARLAMPVTSRRRQRRLATALGGAALVGATATMAVAAQTALPGESLYGVKRGIESAQVRLAGDDAARGRTLLAQADVRLDELERIAAGDGGREQLVASTLDTFTDQSSDGVRDLLSAYDAGGGQQDAQQAQDFTSRSVERLDALEEQLPAAARDELLAAGRTLSDLDLEVSSACAVCTGGIDTMPGFLLTSAQPDLLSGLDVDELTLETAPLSGQDLTGIEVPEVLQQPVPTASTQVPGTPGVPSQTPTPTTTPTTSPVPPTPTTPTTPVPTRTPDPTQTVEELTQGVTGTTGTLVGQVDEVTGGAVGGLTSTVDNATGGLIGEVTGSIDQTTGGTLGQATGGLLP